VGSSALGQLLVWEWRSETYVLKQQGHLFGMSSVDFSPGQIEQLLWYPTCPQCVCLSVCLRPDGSFIATAGEDGKVKIWNASSGFCFVTFSEHVAPGEMT
jgi:periodic tryptophan protein 2